MLVPEDDEWVGSAMGEKRPEQRRTTADKRRAVTGREADKRGRHLTVAGGNPGVAGIVRWRAAQAAKPKPQA